MTVTTSASRSPTSIASGAFYDAVFCAIGARRMHESERRDRLGHQRPRLLDDERSPRPAPGYGHVALRARGRVAVDAALSPRASPRAAPTPGRPARDRSTDPRYYAAYLRDPDGLKVEVVADGR